MDENWDEPEKTKPEGIIFGGRGRGFKPACERSPERTVGRPSRSEESKENDDNKYCADDDDNYCADDNNEVGKNLGGSRPSRTRNRGDPSENEGDGAFGGRRERRDRHDREPKNAGSKHEDPESSRPKPSRYIPETPTENEEEIFGSGISSGINFDKYDDIKVTVSGENPPPPINTFEECGLQDNLMELIKKCKYVKPTPIQKHSIPIIRSGRDLMACAQTGSGKTAAFLIPIISRLLESTHIASRSDYLCKPKALVVTPTRELTVQIFSEARKFSRGLPLKIQVAYGGTSVSHQIQLLTRKGCDLLVATPGRLLDIMRKGKVVFDQLQFCVLDEADRMLDMGFFSDMEDLMEHVLREAECDIQTLMFSATFPEEIRFLALKFLKHSLFVAVGVVGGACSDVEQTFYEVSKYEKRDKLLSLLEGMRNEKCLIFVEQKRATDVLATFLSEKNYRATSIHGDREQREREEALNDFKSGNMDILVATSVAARGLDIKDVAHVINYDLPKSIDEYVHRIGRTGRVGNRGSAISFYDGETDRQIVPNLLRILQQTGQVVPDYLKNYNKVPLEFDYESILDEYDYESATPNIFDTW